MALWGNNDKCWNWSNWISQLNYATKLMWLQVEQELVSLGCLVKGYAQVGDVIRFGN